ncbi:hypothetical protein K435DRAFT_867574 [Dendrothele bispora CBS 962.96]|uniref:Retrovirus-related Pol polyprotein from transposon TNT 1-94-like beta-barrel domain-containing protein n=1 Tax=Dendrothele bispora (strain CBS 962.96) TaxID=1314807 RepID=A0A4S8LEB1_DENBC|nr:hypothetical protein K435DRAFT_867574 [Dendrothele bispora CBS 962.96]
MSRPRTHVRGPRNPPSITRPTLPTSSHDCTSLQGPPTLPSAIPQLGQRLLIDSSVPFNIIRDRSAFQSYLSDRKVIRCLNGTIFEAVGYGSVLLQVTAMKEEHSLRPSMCYHVPSARHHILSVTSLLNGDMQVILAHRSPRIILPLKARQAQPSLPKYYPLSREKTHFFLKCRFALTSTVPLPPHDDCNPQSFTLTASSH